MPPKLNLSGRINAVAQQGQTYTPQGMYSVFSSSRAFMFISGLTGPAPANSARVGVDTNLSTMLPPEVSISFHGKENVLL